WYGNMKNEVFRGDILWKPSDNFSLRLTGTEDDLVGTPVMIARWTDNQSVGSKGQNLGVITAYNIAMLNPAYGPYTFNTTGTPWISRFAGEGNEWSAPHDSWQYPGGRIGKWETNEFEPLNSEQEYTTQYTLTGTWDITPHMKFTNLA